MFMQIMVFLDVPSFSILKRSITRNSFSHSSYCCYYYFYKEFSLFFWAKYHHVEGYLPLFQRPCVFSNFFSLQCSFIRCTYPHRLRRKPHNCTTRTSVMFSLAHEIDSKIFLFRQWYGKGQHCANEYEN